MSHKKKGRKRDLNALEINMTAMCDVIFQLLIYLIMTSKPPIVLANLDVNRPAADARAAQDTKIEGMVEIMVFEDAYVVEGKRVKLSGIDKFLGAAAQASRNQTVLIKCAWDSTHEKLVNLLNICAKYKLTNLSVMSM